MEKFLAFNIGDAYNAPIRSGDPGPIISNLISVVLVVSGIIIVFAFIFGGISMIAGAGTRNPESIAKGKRAIVYALIGFLVVFTSYWVIQFIELVADSDFITNPPI